MSKSTKIQRKINRNKPYRIISRIYNNQHKDNFKSPNYSLDQLVNWMYNQTNFNKLYKDYFESNYNIDLIPSVDRLNDYKPYTLDNIRLVTWKENRERYHKDRSNGKNNKQNNPIFSIDLYGKKVNYHSIRLASRLSGVDRSIINRSLLGKYKYYDNLKWYYNEDNKNK